MIVVLVFFSGVHVDDVNTILREKQINEVHKWAAAKLSRTGVFTGQAVAIPLFLCTDNWCESVYRTTVAAARILKCHTMAKQTLISRSLDDSLS